MGGEGELGRGSVGLRKVLKIKGHVPLSDIVHMSKVLRPRLVFLASKFSHVDAFRTGVEGLSQEWPFLPHRGKLRRNRFSNEDVQHPNRIGVTDSVKFFCGILQGASRDPTMFPTFKMSLVYSYTSCS